MSAADRNERIKSVLDQVRSACDREAARAKDPVSFVHRFRDPKDQEIVGLVASSMAFGNVATIRAKVEEILGRIGGRPSEAAASLVRLQKALRGFKHRVFIGDDVARLIAGAGAVQSAHGTLGAAFSSHLAAGLTFQDALAEFCEAIRGAGGLTKGKSARRGPAHILPDVRRGAGSKRLLLFLRWMIRPDDGIDLGAWGVWGVPPSVLLCPVDTHIHKLARNLGFTRRKDVSWTTAEEITDALRRFDAEDPVKYDFSLCHMGMLQRCPSRRDEARCEGCGVKPVCRHWDGKLVRIRRKK